jgi:uncharacterized protein
MFKMQRYKIWFLTLVSVILLMGPFLFVRAGGFEPGQAQAQTEAPTTEPLAETITVVGEGTVQVEPDMAQATIGVQVSNPNLEEATSMVQERMEAVLAALQAQGIAQQDIQTTNFNIFVEPPPGPEAQATTSEPTYRVSNDVRVTVRDLNNIGSLLDAAIEAGANNIYGVNFSVTDDSEARAQAREEAFTKAATQALDLACLAGVQLGEVVRISEIIGSQGGIPFEARAQDISGGGGPIVPGQFEVTTRLEVTYTMQ